MKATESKQLRKAYFLLFTIIFILFPKRIFFQFYLSKINYYCFIMYASSIYNLAKTILYNLYIIKEKKSAPIITLPDQSRHSYHGGCKHRKILNFLRLKTMLRSPKMQAIVLFLFEARQTYNCLTYVYHSKKHSSNKPDVITHIISIGGNKVFGFKEDFFEFEHGASKISRPHHPRANIEL